MAKEITFAIARASRSASCTAPSRAGSKLGAPATNWNKRPSERAYKSEPIIIADAATCSFAFFTCPSVRPSLEKADVVHLPVEIERGLAEPQAH